MRTGQMRWMSAAILLVSGTSLLSGCNRPAPAQSGTEAASDIPVVQVVSPAVETLQRTTTLPATVEAFFKAEIHARAAGYLNELKVDIGQTVAADEVLGVLSVAEMERGLEKQQATVRRLEAEEARAGAAVKLAIANVASVEARRAQAQADVAKTQAQLNADQSEFTRVSQLVEQKAVAERLLDEVRQRFESSQSIKTAAEAAFESSAAAVTVAQEQQAVASADQGAAAAATEVARKELEELEVLMGYATLRAPFNGVVTQRNVDPGDLVRNIQTASESSRKPLFEVAQVDRVRIQIAVPELDAPLATIGDPVTIRFRALPGRTETQPIARIARRLDESTRTMMVEVDLPNEDGTLLPGMFGEAVIVLSEVKDAILLPASAVRFSDKGNASVYVVKGDGTVSVVPVTTGFDNGKSIQILSGIDATASVVDGGVGRLQEGQHVRTR